MQGLSRLLVIFLSISVNSYGSPNKNGDDDGNCSVVDTVPLSNMPFNPILAASLENEASKIRIKIGATVETMDDAGGNILVLEDFSDPEYWNKMQAGDKLFDLATGGNYKTIFGSFGFGGYGSSDTDFSFGIGGPGYPVGSDFKISENFDVFLEAIKHASSDLDPASKRVLARRTALALQQDGISQEKISIGLAQLHQSMGSELVATMSVGKSEEYGIPLKARDITIYKDPKTNRYYTQDGQLIQDTGRQEMLNAVRVAAEKGESKVVIDVREVHKNGKTYRRHAILSGTALHELAMRKRLGAEARDEDQGLSIMADTGNQRRSVGFSSGFKIGETNVQAFAGHEKNHTSLGDTETSIFGLAARGDLVGSAEEDFGIELRGAIGATFREKPSAQAEGANLSLYGVPTDEGRKETDPFLDLEGRVHAKLSDSVEASITGRHIADDLDITQYDSDYTFIQPQLEIEVQDNIRIGFLDRVTMVRDYEVGNNDDADFREEFAELYVEAGDDGPNGKGSFYSRMSLARAGGLSESNEDTLIAIADFRVKQQISDNLSFYETILLHHGFGDEDTMLGEIGGARIEAGSIWQTSDRSAITASVAGTMGNLWTNHDSAMDIAGSPLEEDNLRAGIFYNYSR